MGAIVSMMGSGTVSEEKASPRVLKENGRRKAVMAVRTEKRENAKEGRGGKRTRQRMQMTGRTTLAMATHVFKSRLEATSMRKWEAPASCSFLGNMMVGLLAVRQRHQHHPCPLTFLISSLVSFLLLLLGRTDLHYL